VDRPFSVLQLEPLMTATPYTAGIRRDGLWWIGWVEEVPGVNSQGETREELLSNLREALNEAIEMNREDARKAAGEQFEEVALQP
jgi:predicted RNase H-like HicB family nuclease